MEQQYSTEEEWEELPFTAEERHDHEEYLQQLREEAVDNSYSKIDELRDNLKRIKNMLGKVETYVDRDKRTDWERRRQDFEKIRSKAYKLALGLQHDLDWLLIELKHPLPL